MENAFSQFVGLGYTPSLKGWQSALRNWAQVPIWSARSPCSWIGVWRPGGQMEGGDMSRSRAAAWERIFCPRRCVPPPLWAPLSLEHEPGGWVLPDLGVAYLFRVH